MQVRVLARFYFKGSEEQRSKGSKLKIKLCVFAPSWHKKNTILMKVLAQLEERSPPRGKDAGSSPCTPLFLILSEIKN
jgi:hypothetical protein